MSKKEKIENSRGRRRRTKSRQRLLEADPALAGDIATGQAKWPSWCAPKMTPQEVKGISTLRGPDGEVSGEWVKSHTAAIDPPAFQPVGPGFAVKGVSTYFGPQGDVRGQHVSTVRSEADRGAALLEAIEKAVARYEGLCGRVPAPAVLPDDLLTLYGIGDGHLGMLARGKETGSDDFDLKIAERELCAAIDILIERTPASRDAIVLDVGDFLHVDNDSQLTPGGKNKLDADSRYKKILEVAITSMEYFVNRVRTKHANTKVIIVPGNHNPQGARVMQLILARSYKNEPRVDVVDNANPTMYHRHGKVLLGFNHGENRPVELPAVMAADRPEDWGQTLYRHWICGHIHHKTLSAKDYTGCTVETLPTLAPRDAWHNEKLYRARRSLCAITYDSEYGELTRATVDIRQVQA